MQIGDLTDFHNDLRVAISLNTPISLDGKSATNINRVSQLEKFVVGELPKHGTFHQCLDENDELPNRYLAALRTYQQTRSMAPVFDGLSVANIASQQLATSIKWIIIYVVATIAVASAGLFWFAFSVVPTLSAIREDMIQTSALPLQSANRFQLIDWSPAISVGAAILFVIVTVAVLALGLRRIGHLLGGGEFIDTKARSIAFQNTYFLAQSGMPVDRAAKVSCDLIGVRQHVQNIFISQSNSISDPEELLALSDHTAMAANRKLSELKVRIPVRLVVIVGGLISLVYCTCIFWPIISLLNDLVSASYGR